jgi:5'-3' exonuclease
MGFKNNFLQAEYEADDLLGWWVNKLFHIKRKLIMVTTDNDMFQCLDKCVIWFPTKKKYFSEKDLIKKYGIKANQWTFAKAIGGCSGDGIEGIKGVGDPKKASSKALKYIRGEIKKGTIYDRIESKEGENIIERNLKLVSIPYKPELLKRMIKRRNKFTRRKFIKIFDQFHFSSFLEKEKFERWKEAFLK